MLSKRGQGTGKAKGKTNTKESNGQDKRPVAMRHQSLERPRTPSGVRQLPTRPRPRLASGGTSGNERVLKFSGSGNNLKDATVAKPAPLSAPSGGEQEKSKKEAQAKAMQREKYTQRRSVVGPESDASATNQSEDAASSHRGTRDSKHVIKVAPPPSRKSTQNYPSATNRATHSHGKSASSPRLNAESNDAPEKLTLVRVKGGKGKEVSGALPSEADNTVPTFNRSRALSCDDGSDPDEDVQQKSRVVDWQELLPPGVPEIAGLDYNDGERVLVLGVGGGCDVFTAYGVAQWLKTRCEGTHFLYGSCTGPAGDTAPSSTKFDALQAHPAAPRPADGDNGDAPCHLYRMPAGKARKLQSAEQEQGAYGTTLLEQSVPRSPEGCPFVFVVPRKQPPLAAADEENSKALIRSLKSLKLQHVIAVDTGGDAITGGVDHAAGEPELGRDRQVLRALRRAGVRYKLIVVGPGSDGESSAATLRKAVHEKQGELQGYFSLQALMKDVRPLVSNLSSDRTPNIVRDALSSSAAETTVTRHGSTNTVPTSWLRIALVFCERLGQARTAKIEQVQEQAQPSDEIEELRKEIATLKQQLAQRHTGSYSYTIDHDGSRNASFGITFENVSDIGDCGDYTCRVQSVLAGGAADLSKLVYPGHLLEEVDGENVVGQDFKHVMELVRTGSGGGTDGGSSKRELRLVARTPPAPSALPSEATFVSVQHTPVQHERKTGRSRLGRQNSVLQTFGTAAQPIVDALQRKAEAQASNVDDTFVEKSGYLTMGFPHAEKVGLKKRHFALERERDSNGVEKPGSRTLLVFHSTTSVRGREFRWGRSFIEIGADSSLERQEGDTPTNFRLISPHEHRPHFNVIQFCADTPAEMDEWLLALRQNISRLRRRAETKRGHHLAASWRGSDAQPSESNALSPATASPVVATAHAINAGEPAGGDTSRDRDAAAVVQGTRITEEMEVPNCAVPGRSVFDIGHWILEPPYVLDEGKALPPAANHPTLKIPPTVHGGQVVQIQWVTGEPLCTVTGV